MVVATSSEVYYSDLPIENVNWCSVPLSEVIGAGKRLDASTFDVEAKRAMSVLDKVAHPKVNLIDTKNTIFVKNAHYGGRLKRGYVKPNKPNAVGFIGSSEMLDLRPQPVKFMDNSDRKTDKLRVSVGTVLLSRSGTVGNLTLVSKTLSKLLVSEHAIRLECVENPGFVYAYLKSKIGQSLIKSKIYGAVVQQIEPEHLSEILIPNPPCSIKKQINDLVLRSYELRDNSNELIDNAVSLLVKELKLPAIDRFDVNQFDSTSGVSNYSVKLSDLSGRLDGSFHTPIADAIEKHLLKYSAEVTTAGDAQVSEFISLPGRFKRIYVAEGQGRVFFGGKQIYELDPSNKKYLSLVHHGDRIKKQLELTENMIILTRSGTIGKVNIVPKHFEHWIASDHIIRIKPASSDIAGYLYVFLSSDYGSILTKRFTYGSVIDEIDDNHVSKIPIPLLKDPYVQAEINHLALKSNEMRHQAYLHEQEAIKILNEEVLFTPI